MNEDPQNPETPEQNEAFTITAKRNTTWERNHALITCASEVYMQAHNRMPGKTELAEITGLSLSTVYVHYNEYRKNLPRQLEQFEVPGAEVLVTMFEQSRKGNVHAAKLFLKVLNNPAAYGFADVSALGGNYLAGLPEVKPRTLRPALSPEQMAELEEKIKNLKPSHFNMLRVGKSDDKPTIGW
jgi:hypothetical protein